MRHRQDLLVLLALSLSACTTTLTPDPGEAPVLAADAAAEAPDTPITAPPDAAPDPCAAPDPMSLGAPASGGVSDGVLVQVNWGEVGDRRAMLQLRAVDGAITARTYDHGASFIELIGPGDIFDCEVRLWVKHPLDDTTFEEFIASEGKVKVTELRLEEPASISFETSGLELVRVQRRENYDYDVHAQGCTRKVVNVPPVLDLPLVQAQG